MKTQFLKLLNNEAISEDETCEMISRMMKDAPQPLSDAQIGAYLFSTASRELSTSELVGGARALRDNMLRVDLGDALSKAVILDTCGTGGSGKVTFNTSTVTAIICAAGGVFVVKHGNRSATSLCGSVDLLEALGVDFDLHPAQIADCLQKTHFCFMFARAHHPATGRVAGIRRELGFRTLFNYLGPLSNPAGATHQLLGVNNPRMLRPIAEALLSLGTKRAVVVSGEDGLDEITLCGSTKVCELKDGNLKEYVISPEDYGFQRVSFSEIEGTEPGEAAKRVIRLLQGEKDACRSLVILNAGAALYTAERAESMMEGVELARELIDSGAAATTLELIKNTTCGL